MAAGSLSAGVAEANHRPPRAPSARTPTAARLCELSGWGVGAGRLRAFGVGLGTRPTTGRVEPPRYLVVLVFGGCTRHRARARLVGVATGYVMTQRALGAALRHVVWGPKVGPFWPQWSFNHRARNGRHGLTPRLCHAAGLLGAPEETISRPHPPSTTPICACKPPLSPV